jgi:hypothetical protein
MCPALEMFAGALLTVGGGVAGWAVCTYLRRDPRWLCVICGRNPVGQPGASCRSCFVHGGPQ